MVAKAITGSEDRMPVWVVDRPRPSRTSARTGPTLTAAGRRLKARTTMPTTTRTLRTAPANSTPGRGVGGGWEDHAMQHVSDAQRRARLGQRHGLAAPLAS